MTQYALAQVAGVAQGYLSQLESGQRTSCSPETLFKLAKALRCPVAVLEAKR